MKKLAAGVAVVVLFCGCGGEESVEPFGIGAKGEIADTEGTKYTERWSYYQVVVVRTTVEKVAAGLPVDTVVKILRDLYLMEKKAWKSMVFRSNSCSKTTGELETVTIAKKGNAIVVTQISEGEKIEIVYSRGLLGNWTSTASRNDAPLNNCTADYSPNYFSELEFSENPAQITTKNQARGTCAYDVCMAWKRGDASKCEGVFISDFTSTFTNNTPEESVMAFTTTIRREGEQSPESRTCEIRYIR